MDITSLAEVGTKPRTLHQDRLGHRRREGRPMPSQKVTRQTVGSAVTKVVPVLGVVAGTLTSAIFYPMGQRRTYVFVNNLNGTFAPKRPQEQTQPRIP